MDTVRYGKVRFTADELARMRFERTDVTDAAGMARVVGGVAAAPPLGRPLRAADQDAGGED